MSELVKEFEKTFGNEDDDALAEIWRGLCLLKNYNLISVMQIMSYIEHKITLKKCLRYHNKDTMSDEEFEAWWRNSPHE